MSTATTMSAPGYTVGNTTINVGSTTNWPTDTGVTFAVDEVANGERVAGTYNVFRGTVASGTQLANVTYVGGDANRNYSAGATTRVYILVSYAQTNRMIDGLLVSHDQDGTLKDNAVVTANITDSNVTTAKIADASVTASKLATGATRAYVTADEGTSSASFVDLATTTDTVTVTVPDTGMVLVSIAAQITTPAAAGAGGAVGFDVSGANTIAASFDNGAVVINNSTASLVQITTGRTQLLTGLTPGSTTFKMKYARVTSGTCNFRRREILVIPLG